MAASVSSAAKSSRKLWVHLDVNKTLIAVDPASGQDLQTALNGALGMVVQGILLPTRAGCQVHSCLDDVPDLSLIDGTTRPLREGRGFRFLDPSVGLSIECPSVPLPDGVAVEDCLSLVRFVDDYIYPYMVEVGCEDRGLEAPTVRAENHEIKMARRTLLARLLGPGGVGGKLYAGMMASMLEALSVPEDLQAAYGASGMSADGEGKCRFLVPGYFRLLDWLAANRPDSTIVFRTFGSDVPEVVAEHNAYCEGTHPLYKGSGAALGGKSGAADWRVAMPHMTGRILRFSDSKLGMAMAAVTVTNGDRAMAAGPATFFQGAEQIHHELVARRDLGFRAMAIQDDYRWWKDHDEQGAYGKVLLVKDSGSGLAEELSVFFDDNILPHRAKIVDARDYHTGKPVPFSKSKDLYLRIASIPGVLADPDFFIKGILESEVRADAIVAEDAAAAT